MFGFHRSSYKYWENRAEKPDGRQAVLRSQVLKLPNISHGYRDPGNAERLPDKTMACWQAHERAGAGEL